MPTGSKRNGARGRCARGHGGKRTSANGRGRGGRERGRGQGPSLRDAEKRQDGPLPAQRGENLPEARRRRGLGGEDAGFLSTEENREGRVSEDETSQELELQSQALNWEEREKWAQELEKGERPPSGHSAPRHPRGRPSLGDPLRAAPDAPGTAQAVRPVRKPLVESQLRVPGHEWRGPRRLCAVPCARASQAQVAASDASLRPWQHRCVRSSTKGGPGTNAESAETAREGDSRSSLT